VRRLGAIPTQKKKMRSEVLMNGQLLEMDPIKLRKKIRRFCFRTIPEAEIYI
jgi:hypothetical protein